MKDPVRNIAASILARPKLKVENSESESLTDIIDQLWRFLKEPLRSAVHKLNSSLKWIPNKGWK